LRGTVAEKTARGGTLAGALAELADALQPINGPGRGAAVWTLVGGVRLVRAAPGVPAALIEAATQRLRAGERRFDVVESAGAGGTVYVCDVGSEQVAYGLFVFDDGRDDLRTSIARLIAMAEATLGKGVGDMSRTEKQQVVRFLDDRGAFLIRRAVEDVADRLGVSRFTVYNYLDRDGG
jgi:hypothetical protein